MTVTVSPRSDSAGYSVCLVQQPVGSYRRSFPTRRSSDLVLWEENGEALRYLGQRMTISGFQQTVRTGVDETDRKSTRLNSSHRCISYAVFCLKKKKNQYTAPKHNTRKIYNPRLNS